MAKDQKTYKDKSISELQREVENLTKEIEKLSIEQKAVPQKDTNSLFKRRKMLAVASTILTEKREVERLKK